MLTVAGLSVYSTRLARTFEFIEDGGLRGRGYLPYLRTARHSLFLTHADDDSPSDELLAVYRELLERNVEMRRGLFLRGDGRGASWIARFGDHPRLLQKAVLPDRAEVMRISFVVVDEEVVILSVPGFGPLDDGSYTDSFVLRHLLVMRDRAVARVFLSVHEHLWNQAAEITTGADLEDPAEFVARARERRGG